MSDALVRAAFETRLSAWAAAQVPAIPVAWEEVSFSPPPTRYIRAWLLRAPTQNEAWDSNHRLRRGIFQVDLCIPSNSKGTGEATALAASLDATFSLAAPMTQGDIKVFLLSPMSPVKGPLEGTHNVTHVSCEYRSDTI